MKAGETLSRENTKETKIAPKGLKTFAIETYNLLASGSSSVVSLEDFDIYYDDTTGNILAVDFRVNYRGISNAN